MKNKYNSIVLFDTSIASSNMGDSIIMESINQILIDIFYNFRISRVSSHQGLGFNGRNLCYKSDLKILCGSNLLGSIFFKRNQLKLGLTDFFAARNLVLMGVGWRQYNDDLKFYNNLKLKVKQKKCI